MTRRIKHGAGGATPPDKAAMMPTHHVPNPNRLKTMVTTESRSLIVNELYNGRLAEVHVSGRLDKKDYEIMLPELERLIRSHGKIHLLVVLHNFRGWSAGALWEDLKFGFKHYDDVERLAIIGDERWQAGSASFSMPFTRAEVRYFPSEKGEVARHWIDEGLT